MKKVIFAFAFLFSLFISVPSFAGPSVAGPCLSGICIGESFSQIAGRQWLADDTSFWSAPTDFEYKRIPVSEPVLSQLNAPKVANLGVSSARIRNPKGVELMQQAHFCGAYWFELHTPDEHGWDTKVVVMPVVSGGKTELRVVQLVKTINQPLITEEQVEQRLRNFTTQFAAYQPLSSPFTAHLTGAQVAVVLLGYRRNFDEMLAEQNNHLRAQPGCQQAAAGF